MLKFQSVARYLQKQCRLPKSLTCSRRCLATLQDNHSKSGHVELVQRSNTLLNSKCYEPIVLCSFHRRRFHGTTVLARKRFDPKLYDLVDVYDPTGNFIVQCEMLVLQKFRTRFNRFTYDAVDSANVNNSSNPNFKTDVKCYELKDKPANTETDGIHQKSMNFKKKVEDLEKNKRIITMLVNHNTVVVTYKRGAPPGVNADLQVYGEIAKRSRSSETGSGEENIVLHLKPLDVELFRRLFADVYSEEEKHIKEVHEMMKEMTKDS